MLLPSEENPGLCKGRAFSFAHWRDKNDSIQIQICECPDQDSSFGSANADRRQDTSCSRILQVFKVAIARGARD